ncbi:alpha/beta hydrolase [Saccharopolyspora sp. WRP15-2]|uniref:Alpha/beta hydrolase n=1 Tax=Saccharopolyspora oryzae TaxID=2997343 RepID=A0ABT4UQS1_9PSEU|nr:alpha/beta hydrolase [Saccharopolyspora oryzae]MDA3624059.1 alpha/beta hydrolase [Saccharopolyspora oryzae]
MVADDPRVRVEFRGLDGIKLVADRWEPEEPGDSLGTVLLLHGGGQTRHSWARTAQVLASRGWTAIAVDARGHGDSDRSPDGSYTLDHFAGDVHGIARDCDHPPVLIGASLGGRASLALAGDHPDSISGLVLVDIAARTEESGRSEVREFMASAPNGYASLEEVAEAINAYNPSRRRPRNLEGLKKNLRLHADGRWYWHWDPAFLRYAETDLDETTARLNTAARKVTAPTLVVRGNKSNLVTPEAVAELLELVPTARAVEVTAGHMIAGDDNDIFATHLFEFLTTDVLDGQAARSRNS